MRAIPRKATRAPPPLPRCSSPADVAVYPAAVTHQVAADPAYVAPAQRGFILLSPTGMSRGLRACPHSQSFASTFSRCATAPRTPPECACRPAPRIRTRPRRRARPSAARRQAPETSPRACHAGSVRNGAARGGSGKPPVLPARPSPMPATVLRTRRTARGVLGRCCRGSRFQCRIERVPDAGGGR